MRVSIPGRGTYELRHLVLDLNGTLALDGQLLEGVKERLVLLKDSLRPVVLTANTHGSASRVQAELGLEVIVLEPEGDEAQQKLLFVRRLGPEQVVAIGNGANDALMLRESAVGICVLGPEGAASEALGAADIVVSQVSHAFELLERPQRLIATLRR